MTPSEVRWAGLLIAERARRTVEGLRLYEPLPHQEPFHASRARVRLLRGSNRGGKTLPAAAEVARAATGRDPHKKYPAEGGRFFCVGKDNDHLGQVMWRKLGRAGAFRMIRDEHTGRWRSFRPWLPYDEAYREKAKEAPPLIPPRYVKEVGWENKKEGVPSVVKLVNGWELSFYSSLGKPPQGSDIDGCWFDEEIVDADWFPEMSARLLDRSGLLVWSATPQAGTEQLYELHEQAERERDLKLPAVAEFVILLADNPHVTEENKRAFALSLSEDEHRVRVGGDFAVESFKVYPEFSMSVHGVEWFDVPRDWCRYLVVDPGHQVCAVLFAAVPPPPGRGLYLYDELYLKECNADLFGRSVAHKAAGVQFEAFVIDAHMAMHTEVGVGRNVGEQYAEALKRYKVKSRATGHGFAYGSDDVQAGVLAVHDLLRLAEDGRPRLRVLKGALPSFEWEVKRYHKKREAGRVLDAPNQRKNNHLMDALRYLAMYDPKYVRPKGGKAPAGAAVRAFRAKKKRKDQEQGGRSVRLGPGRNPW